MPFFNKPSNRQINKGYIKLFGLEKWYAGLTPQQQNLLRQARPDLNSTDISSTSETVGQFISSCAEEIARYDVDFAEQLYHTALEFEQNPVRRHYILMRMAAFYRNKSSNPVKWFKVIQDDLALIPAFAKTWMQQEEFALPSYPAIDEMLRILHGRGDLPEALALCKRALETGIAGDWETQIRELQRKMQD